MSVSAAIYIYFDQPVDVVKLINDLVESGWSYEDHGQIAFLPFGDDDCFDWQNDKLENWEKIQEILTEKASLEELVGLALTWKDTQIGGEILAHPSENYITFSLTINRQTTNENNNTDFSWYQEKFVVNRYQ